MNISATSGPIKMKSYQKHHWDGGKAALGFFFSAVFHPILFILAGNDDMHGNSEEFEIQPYLATDCEVSCP